MPENCLYCGLQYDDTTRFCPNCGRPTESDFSIRPKQDDELKRLREEIQEKDEQIRQLKLKRARKRKAPKVR